MALVHGEKRKGFLSPFPMGGKCEQKKLLPLHKDEGKGTAESGENKKIFLEYNSFALVE